MADLNELAEWTPGIYQLETDDPVQGGPDGIDNLQAKQLANRTAYLKALVETQTAGKQPLDATLTALAALVTAANQIIYSTGSDAFATTGLSAFMRTLLDDADAAAARTTLGTAPLDSPGFTGTPTAPTAVAGTNNTQIANTAFVQAAVAALVASSPAALDTLNELAAALGDDPNFATTMTNALAGKQPIHATLTALASIATEADKLIYAIGPNSFATTPLTPFARSLLGTLTAAAAREALQINAGAIQSISASVAANELTVTVPPTSLDFRDATLGSGTVNNRTLAASASLIVPAGATLGTISGRESRLVVLLVDNAGVLEPAIINLAGSVSLNEAGVISTTAISALATDADVVYASSALVGVPYRVVGAIKSTQPVAGTWDTAPSLIQGMGGISHDAVAGTGGVQWITASTTFVVPASTIRVRGCGGGGGVSASTGGSPGNGGTTSFGVYCSAAGGARADVDTQFGAGGAATGGDINITGGRGSTTINTAGSGGAVGGANGTVSAAYGEPGLLGGRAGGSASTCPVSGYGNGAGSQWGCAASAGGYFEKVITGLTVGDTIDVTIGAGGVGYGGGAAGRPGVVIVEW